MRHCFWQLLTILYISCTETENDVEDKSTKDVQTLLVTAFPYPWDKKISIVSKMLIINELCGKEIWR